MHYSRFVPFSFFFLLTLMQVVHAAKPHFLPMDDSLMPLAAKDGRQWLLESSANEAFWHLSQFYATQPDLGSCGVASATMVLNALPIDRPISKYGEDFPLFTAENLFSPEVNKIISSEKVSNVGMTLDELGRVFGTFGLSVETQFASETNEEEFCKSIKTSLQKADSYVVVNYWRKAINQKSGGHISPLGAYNDKNEKNKVVLILDTSNYKYPWTWVRVESLWKAMAEADPTSGRSRGFLVVSMKELRIPR